jgi:lysozyme family protein
MLRPCDAQSVSFTWPPERIREGKLTMDRDRLAQQVRDQITQLLAARDAMDDAARTQLLAQIDALEDVLRDIRIANTDDLVREIGASVDALERIRTEHALDAVAALGSAIDGLSAAEHAIRRDAQVAAPPTLVTTLMRAALPVAAGSVAVLATTAVIHAVRTRNSNKYDDLKDEYVDLFGRCVARPERQADIDRMARRIRSNQTRYQAVGEPLGVPWRFVGITHALEGSLDFNTHLHNGDPLTARTVSVPKGRPATGNPPFTWEESATDALRIKKLDRNEDWSTPRMLYLLEGFNGYGYRPLNLPSPYLWSFSTLYEKGKFVADHVFDSEAVSKQCGAALLLQALA